MGFPGPGTRTTGRHRPRTHRWLHDPALGWLDILEEDTDHMARHHDDDHDGTVNQSDDDWRPDQRDDHAHDDDACDQAQEQPDRWVGVQREPDALPIGGSVDDAGRQLDG